MTLAQRSSTRSCTRAASATAPSVPSTSFVPSSTVAVQRPRRLLATASPLTRSSPTWRRAEVSDAKRTGARWQPSASTSIPCSLPRAMTSRAARRPRLTGPGGGRRQRCDRAPSRDRGHITFSPRTKKSLELALREALRLGHREISSEHLLLGILREGQWLACRMITDRGVSIVDLRRELELTLLRTA
jgi:Clp amino terminal domain, pathogenicity island component